MRQWKGKIIGRLKKENYKIKKENFSLKKENDMYKKEYEYLRVKYSNKKTEVEFLEGEVFGRTRVKVEKCTAANKRPGEYFEPECSEEKRRLEESVTETTEEETIEAGAAIGNGTETSEEETTETGVTNGNGTEAPEKGDTAAGTIEQRLS